jgi:hypothetical protein
VENAEVSRGDVLCLLDCLAVESLFIIYSADAFPVGALYQLRAGCDAPYDPFFKLGWSRDCGSIIKLVW